MRGISRVAVVAVMLSAGGWAGMAQAVSGQPVAAGNTEPPAPAARGSSNAGADPTAAEPDKRTEKQKELARQTERLFDMATELKVQVDKTNKNILSMKVVEKAEEIERLAKGMKEQAKR